MESWVIYVDRATWLIPAVLSLGCFGLIAIKRTSIHGYQQVIVSYLVAALAFDILSRFWALSNATNLVLVTAYGAVELWFFSVLYVGFFLKRFKVISFTLVVCGTVFIGIESWLTWNAPQQSVAFYQTYTRAVVSFIIVILGILFVAESLDEQIPTVPNLHRLNRAIVCFYALNFVFYLPINFFVSADTYFKYTLWAINILVLFLFYVYLIQHVWRFGKNKKQLSFGS